MSELGHSRQFDGVPVTSANPPITDMFGRNRRKRMRGTNITGRIKF